MDAGLFHPFDGGCSEPNDMIQDTAQQAVAQYGCAKQAPNSCPNKPAGQPSLDPIHNYMGYSSDACMTGFTPLQGVRMAAIWVRHVCPEGKGLCLGCYEITTPASRQSVKWTGEKIKNLVL